MIKLPHGPCKGSNVGGSSGFTPNVEYLHKVVQIRDQVLQQLYGWLHKVVRIHVQILDELYELASKVDLVVQLKIVQDV